MKKRTLTEKSLPVAKRDMKIPSATTAGRPSVRSNCRRRVSTLSVTVNPTSTLNGTRTRTCTVCGHYETETIPAVGTTTVKDPEPASTTERVRPANTTEEDTDPPVVTDRAGKTNDLSRIFLIALIVIFIIIIIIIIASILVERKKERERKRRAAMRRKRSGQ